MKAVVIGAFGHIGTYLVPMLVNGGYDVIAISRGMAKPYVDDPAFEKITRVIMDRDKEPDFAAKIAEFKAEIVIDLINFNISETKKMVAALNYEGFSHYLYCSSAWVNSRAELLPLNDDPLIADPICDYGRDKLASDKYLREQFEQNDFPFTSIRPGHISGYNWPIIGPWGNLSVEPLKKIIRGEEVLLPNFGMETLHHVHGYDVAQCFYKSITHRENALGQAFFATTGRSITTYGYTKMMFEFFGKEPKIGFLAWDKWCEYEGNAEECEATYLHLARSGYYTTDRERELIDYQPKYNNVETIKLAVQGYIDRGVLTIE